MKKITILENKSDKYVSLSVAMPAYNANNTYWLALESLANQKEVDFYWELLICEEIHDNQIGVENIKKFVSKLQANKCVRILFIQLDDWKPLSFKWKEMGKNVSNLKGAFLLQAADCYSQPLRLKITHYNLLIRGYDWIDFRSGYFYSFLHKKVILYSGNYKTNLDMAFRSNFLENVTAIERNKGIDGHLLFCCRTSKRRFRKISISEHHLGGVDTDGFNNISKKRSSHYLDPKPPFYKIDLSIHEIDLPDYIVDKIKKYEFD